MNPMKDVGGVAETILRMEKVSVSMGDNSIKNR